MKVKVGEQEVFLDPVHLEVKEENLNDFLIKFSGIYSYYSAMVAKAQFIQYLTEDKYDQVFNERYQWYKENEGGSDKLAEAKAIVNEPVIKARKAAREAKFIAQLLSAYVRSLDKAHENALNLGYNIRKEVDKIFAQTIKEKSDIPPDIEKQVEKVFEQE